MSTFLMSIRPYTDIQVKCSDEIRAAVSDLVVS